jgi:hypothetical protein
VAIEKLTDQSLLADLVKNCNPPYVRKAAMLKFSDRTILKEIATKGTDLDVRDAARKRLEELEGSPR